MRRHEAAAVPAGNAGTQDLDWKILYASLVRDLGLDPGTFQLIYPYTAWSWPATSLGYTSAAQYDFCATMPQWSLAGAYVSSGARFSGAYAMMLSVLKVFTPDPKLVQAIDRQQQVVQERKNAYDLAYQRAAAAYEKATQGTNDPLFDVWLATTEADPWRVELAAAWTAYEQEYLRLRDLLARTRMEGLDEALADFTNPDFYTRYQDPALAGFPLVPAYTLSKTAAQWVAEVQAGGGTPGTVSLHLGKGAAQGLAERAWTERWIPVSYPFFGVAREEPGQSAASALAVETEITLLFDAWAVIDVIDGDWYDGAFVCRHRDGPFIRGYSGDPDGGDVHLWGQGGAMSLRKTALLVAYNPHFELTPEAHASVRKMTGAARRIRVGPFVGEVVEAGRPRRLSAAGVETTIPEIFGVNVEVLPCGKPAGKAG